MVEDTVSQDEGGAADTGTANPTGNVFQFPTAAADTAAALDQVRAKAGELVTAIVLAPDKDGDWRSWIPAHTQLDQILMARAILDRLVMNMMGSGH